VSWGARFDDPIALANGRKLLTLKDGIAPGNVEIGGAALLALSR
jgi:hypothetical protein